MSWIAFVAWLGLTSVFLADGPLLVAALGDRMSAASRSVYLAVPLLFGPAALLLTPWRPWASSALLAVVLLHLAGHVLWVRSLALRPVAPELAQQVSGLCREWGTPEPAAVAAGPFGPAVVGLRRQTLVLPAAVLGLPEADLRAVLAHELAHVAARDSLKLWLAGMGRTLLCWHPLARVSLDALRLQVELAADARAAAWLGDRRRYALALGRWGLALAARGGAPAWGAALAERPAELTIRIQRLLEPDSPPVRELRLPAWLTRAFVVRSAKPRPPRWFGSMLILLVLAGYLTLFWLVLQFP